jgi:hypothetical protein
MSHTYLGIDPITFGQFAAPGVVVNPQPAGSGAYALPLVVDGGDKRSAANLMAGIEANRDCINWLTWRTVDWISGGDYRSLFKAQVSLSNVFIFDRSALHAGGLNTLTVQGDLDGGAAIWAQSNAGDSTAIQAWGHGSGNGIQSVGGASGSGATCRAGAGSKKFGIEAFGDGTNWNSSESFGVYAHSGVRVQDGPLVRNGNASAEWLRELALPFGIDTNGSMDPSIADLFLTDLSGKISANRTWKLLAPSSKACVRARLYIKAYPLGPFYPKWPNGTTTITIQDNNTGAQLWQFVWNNAIGSSLGSGGALRWIYSPIEGSWLPDGS